jgi:hypothetical protein
MGLSYWLAYRFPSLGRKTANDSRRAETQSLYSLREFALSEQDGLLYRFPHRFPTGKMP